MSYRSVVPVEFRLIKLSSLSVVNMRMPADLIVLSFRIDRTVRDDLKDEIAQYN